MGSYLHKKGYWLNELKISFSAAASLVPKFLAQEMADNDNYESPKHAKCTQSQESGQVRPSGVEENPHKKWPK